MKHLIQAVVVAALFAGAQAKAEEGFIVVPSEWTYADRAAPGGAADPFPGSAKEDPIVVESMSTYTDRHAAGIAQEPVASAFPVSAPEMIVLESQSTRADRFAAGASDAALSQ